MKKIIFLLLITVASYGQTLQNSTFGTVKIKQNTTDTAATKVNVQASDGTVNTISKVDLQDAFYYSSASAFPVTGITDKLYIARDNNILYRFNGTIYVPLSADISGKEDIANKSSSFTASSTVTYANTKALVDGLATKQNTITGTANVIPKFGSGGLVGSNISDNGSIITTTTDLSINGVKIGRGNGSEVTNVAVGQNALSSNTTGVNNVGLGQTSLQSNTTGVQNLGIGHNSLTNNTTGNGNLGIGTATLFLITSGSSKNVALGTGSLVNATLINRNTGVGDASFINLLSGEDNVAIGQSTGGFQFGDVTAVNTSTFIGASSRPLGNNQSNQIVIGFDAIGAGSNTATLGNTSITSTILRGAVTAGTSIVSPILTGTPTSPTAVAGTNTTQIATTAFVLANGGSGTTTLQNTYDNTANGTILIGATKPVILKNNTATGPTKILTINTSTDVESITVLGNGIIDIKSTAGALILSSSTSYTSASTPTLVNKSGLFTIFGSSSTSPTLRSGVSFDLSTNTANTLRTLSIPNLDGTIVVKSQVAEQLKDFFTDVNNVGITETDLYTYTTVANRLNATGEKIISNYGGTFNDGTASSQLKIYYAGNVIGDTGVLTMSVTGAFVINVSIMRTGATTARSIVNITTPGASTASYTKYTSLTGLTFTATNIIKITGTASGATGGDNDITATYGNILWQPAAL